MKSSQYDSDITFLFVKQFDKFQFVFVNFKEANTTLFCPSGKVCVLLVYS